MKRILSAALVCLSFSVCEAFKKAPQLTDGDIGTSVFSKAGSNRFEFDLPGDTDILQYRIFASGETQENDPARWELKGTVDGFKWDLVDKRAKQEFCSRFQDNVYTIAKPKKYKKFRLEVWADKNAKLALSEIAFDAFDSIGAWKDFHGPNVVFTNEAPDSDGGKLFSSLVQEPEEFMRDCARKVVRTLYFSPEDEMPGIVTINFALADFDGVAYKSGHSDIKYSVRHIRNVSNSPLHEFSMENRGVVVHEVVHCYQIGPKGDYQNNKEIFACVEGLADAVRADLGLFDMRTRQPGGNWADGYRTTGFFIQWLKTKDPDAIRKFNLSCHKLDEWSFDAAMKFIFGSDATIEGLWQEYQDFLAKN